MTCPLCAGDAETLAELPASITSEARPLNAASRLELCGDCGHLFTHADVDWHTYYSQSYDATLSDDGLDELVVTADGRAVFRTELDYGLFRRMVKDALHAAARVLELGCGRGRILSRLTRDGFRRVWACDVSERYRAKAAELLGADRVSIGTIPDGPFDVITTFFVLEHDVDPRATLSALRERLAEGGTLFVMVPNWQTNLGDLACADHVHHFSPASLTALLQSVGLEPTGLDTDTAGTLAVTAQRSEARPSLQSPERVQAQREQAQPFLRLLDRLEALKALDPNRRLYLYGAGFHAALASAFVPKVSGVFDANPRKQGLERLGHTVAAPTEISRAAHGDDCLLVCVNAAVATAVADQYRGAFHRVLLLS